MFYSRALCQAAENASCPPPTDKQNEQGLVSALVAPRKIAAAAVAEGESCEFASAHYFALCGLGGVLSCGITHTMVTPLDLVKCRIQVDPVKYKSIVNGFRASLRRRSNKASDLTVVIFR